MTKHDDEDEGAGRPGDSLRGPGEAQAARRRWYFANIDRLREHHRTVAGQHRAELEKTPAPEHEPDVKRRNQHREREYAIQMREYEEHRLGLEEAKLRWQEMRSDILHNGGIKASTVGEDYAGIPVDLRRRDGLQLDSMGSQFGYDYERDFERDIEATYTRYKEARATKLERPTKPKFEPEGRRRIGDVHGDNPEVRALLNEYVEARKMLKEGEKELGRNHPALADLKEATAEMKKEYVSAARAAGERPISS